MVCSPGHLNMVNLAFVAMEFARQQEMKQLKMQHNSYYDQRGPPVREQAYSQQRGGGVGGGYSNGQHQHQDQGAGSRGQVPYNQRPRHQQDVPLANQRGTLNHVPEKEKQTQQQSDQEGRHRGGGGGGGFRQRQYKPRQVSELYTFCL